MLYQLNYLREHLEAFAHGLAQAYPVQASAEKVPPPVEDDLDDDDGDFWDSYTSWRDEELARQAGK